MSNKSSGCAFGSIERGEERRPGEEGRRGKREGRTEGMRGEKGVKTDRQGKVLPSHSHYLANGVWISTVEDSVTFFPFTFDDAGIALESFIRFWTFLIILQVGQCIQ